MADLCRNAHGAAFGMPVPLSAERSAAKPSTPGPPTGPALRRPVGRGMTPVSPVIARAFRGLRPVATTCERCRRQGSRRREGPHQAPDRSALGPLALVTPRTRHRRDRDPNARHPHWSRPRSEPMDPRRAGGQRGRDGRTRDLGPAQIIVRSGPDPRPCIGVERAEPTTAIRECHGCSCARVKVSSEPDPKLGSGPRSPPRAALRRPCQAQ